MFLLTAIRWLREFEQEEISLERMTTVTPSDYTVYAPALPRGTTMPDLRRHFEGGVSTNTLLPAHTPHTLHTLHAAYGEVVDINIGYDYGALIQQYKDRGAMDYERYKIDCEIRYIRSRARVMQREAGRNTQRESGGVLDLQPDQAGGTCCRTNREETLLRKRARIVRHMEEIDAREAEAEVVTRPTEWTAGGAGGGVGTGGAAAPNFRRDNSGGGSGSIRGVRHPVAAYVSFNRERQRNAALKKGKSCRR